MHKKDEISISTKRNRVISANAISVASMAAIALLITTNPVIFRTAYRQDINPPTTGKTSPHVRSTFGPNITGRANGSSIISNGTRGNVGDSIADDGNVPK
jgi:hypothetical protein